MAPLSRRAARASHSFKARPRAWRAILPARQQSRRRKVSMRIDSQLASSAWRIGANRLKASRRSAECSALAWKSLHGGCAAPKPLRSSRMRFSESSPLRLHQRTARESLRRQKLVAKAR